jgi:hypothetical protein
MRSVEYGRSFALSQAAKTTLFAAADEADVPKEAPWATFFQFSKGTGYAAIR